MEGVGVGGESSRTDSVQPTSMLNKRSIRSLNASLYKQPAALNFISELFL